MAPIPASDAATTRRFFCWRFMFGFAATSPRQGGSSAALGSSLQLLGEVQFRLHPSLWRRYQVGIATHPSLNGFPPLAERGIFRSHDLLRIGVEPRHAARNGEIERGAHAFGLE